jgi:hypothetical protein
MHRGAKLIKLQYVQGRICPAGIPRRLQETQHHNVLCGGCDDETATHFSHTLAEETTRDYDLSALVWTGQSSTRGTALNGEDPMPY